MIYINTGKFLELKNIWFQKTLLPILETRRKTIETEDLESRISALEAKNN